MAAGAAATPEQLDALVVAVQGIFTPTPVEVPVEVPADPAPVEVPVEVPVDPAPVDVGQAPL